MNRYDFLLVIVAIVVGLALASILTGIGMIVGHSEQIVAATVPAIWAALIFFLLLHYWWFLWVNKVNVTRFAHFIAFNVFPVCLYLVTCLIFPSSDQFAEGQPVDLSDHFQTQSGKIYLLSITGLAGLAACDYFLYPARHLIGIILIYRVVPTVVLILGLFLAKPWPPIHLTVGIALSIILAFTLIVNDVPLEEEAETQ